EPPTLHVDARLVQISVIVRDRNGVVPNLTKNDFAIFDQGKEQAVAFFNPPNAKAERPGPSLPPGIFSNRSPEGKDSLTNATVILIDLLNTRIENQAYAKAQLLKFLKTLGTKNRLAIYVLGRGLKVLHDFTDNPARLERALAQLRGEVAMPGEGG